MAMVVWLKYFSVLFINKFSHTRVFGWVVVKLTFHITSFIIYTISEVRN